MGLLKNQDPKSRIVGRVFIVFILSLLLNYMWVIVASRLYLVSSALILGKTLNRETILQLFNTPFFLFLMSLYNALIVIAVFLFWRRYDKKEFSEMGVVWDGRAARMLGKGMLWSLAAVAAIVIIGLATGTLAYTGSGFAKYGTGTVLNTLIFGILTFAVMAFGEEVLYRGYMQNNFMDASDRGTAIFFASALYVFGHITICHDTFDFINVLVFGLILGYSYIATGSLYISVGYHFIWRLFNVTVFNIQSSVSENGISMFITQAKGDFFLFNRRLGTRQEFIVFLVELAVLILLYFMTREPSKNKSKKKSKKK